jgi:hypothetical protein
MFFPRAVVAVLIELPAGGFKGAADAVGSAFAGAGEVATAAGGVAAEAARVSPRLLT